MYCQARGIGVPDPTTYAFCQALSMFRIAAILAGVGARAQLGNASSKHAAEVRQAPTEGVGRCRQKGRGGRFSARGGGVGGAGLSGRRRTRGWLGGAEGENKVRSGKTLLLYIRCELLCSFVRSSGGRNSSLQHLVLSCILPPIE